MIQLRKYQNNYNIGIKTAQDIMAPITQSKLKSFYTVGFKTENTLSRYNNLIECVESDKNNIINLYYFTCVEKSDVLNLEFPSALDISCIELKLALFEHKNKRLNFCFVRPKF